MLASLHISNYALIDKVDINFRPGFNAITGETGAGKSIMLGALALIFGGRADMKGVRNQQSKSVIEATFTNPAPYPALEAWLAENDVDSDPSGTVILRREITPAGRSRAFVNDTPVSLQKLQGVASLLVDIHSQHQNQRLSDPVFQLEVIDRVAANEERLRIYSQRFTALRKAMRRLKAAKEKLQRDSDAEQYMRYRHDRIAELRLEPGEQQELEAELEVQRNLTHYKEQIAEILNLLNAEDGSGALDLAAQASQLVPDLRPLIGEDDDTESRLESVVLELRDIYECLEGANSQLEPDDRRLEYLEDRLSAIYSLQREHKVDSVESLLTIQDELARRLSSIDNADALIEDLKKEARQARDLAVETARELSATRKEAALAFGRELRDAASPLGMDNLQVDIRVDDGGDLGPTGLDRIDFMVAFNKNQEPRPLASASGGEMSRLMLSVKSLVAGRMQLPSIIFDEIDQGVSGQIASRMGSMMHGMAEPRQDIPAVQVIAITHLPQVAAQASSHYKVYKADTETATNTHILTLDTEGRIDELALMLAGTSSMEAARATARTLLGLDTLS